MPWQNDRAARQHTAATYGTAWRKIRQQVLDRDRRRCVTCSSTRRLQVDHIKPVSQGGTHHMTNLRTLCEECHDKVTAQQGGGYRKRSSPPADPSCSPTTAW